MTVFKGFLIITKRNLLMVFMYLAIFLTIGILASGSDSNTSGTGFHAQALTVGVVDHDGGVLSKGLPHIYHSIIPSGECRMTLRNSRTHSLTGMSLIS